MKPSCPPSMRSLLAPAVLLYTIFCLSSPAACYHGESKNHRQRDDVQQDEQRLTPSSRSVLLSNKRLYRIVSLKLIEEYLKEDGSMDYEGLVAELVRADDPGLLLEVFRDLLADKRPAHSLSRIKGIDRVRSLLDAMDERQLTLLSKSRELLNSRLPASEDQQQIFAYNVLEVLMGKRFARAAAAIIARHTGERGDIDVIGVIDDLKRAGNADIETETLLQITNMLVKEEDGRIRVRDGDIGALVRAFGSRGTAVLRNVKARVEMLIDDAGHNRQKEYRQLLGVIDTCLEEAADSLISLHTRPSGRINFDGLVKDLVKSGNPEFEALVLERVAMRRVAKKKSVGRAEAAPSGIRVAPDAQGRLRVVKAADQAAPADDALPEGSFWGRVFARFSRLVPDSVTARAERRDETVRGRTQALLSASIEGESDSGAPQASLSAQSTIEHDGSVKSSEGFPSYANRSIVRSADLLVRRPVVLPTYREEFRLIKSSAAASFDIKYVTFVGVFSSYYTRVAGEYLKTSRNDTEQVLYQDLGERLVTSGSVELAVEVLRLLYLQASYDPVRQEGDAVRPVALVRRLGSLSLPFLSGIKESLHNKETLARDTADRTAYESLSSMIRNFFVETSATLAGGFSGRHPGVTGAVAFARHAAEIDSIDLADAFLRSPGLDSERMSGFVSALSVYDIGFLNRLHQRISRSAAVTLDEQRSKINALSLIERDFALLAARLIAESGVRGADAGFQALVTKLLKSPSSEEPGAQVLIQLCDAAVSSNRVAVDTSRAEKMITQLGSRNPNSLSLIRRKLEQILQGPVGRKEQAVCRLLIGMIDTFFAREAERLVSRHRKADGTINQKALSEELRRIGNPDLGLAVLSHVGNEITSNKPRQVFPRNASLLISELRRGDPQLLVEIRGLLYRHLRADDFNPGRLQSERRLMGAIDSGCATAANNL